MPFGQWSGHVWPQQDGKPAAALGKAADKAVDAKAPLEQLVSHSRRTRTSQAWSASNRRPHTPAEAVSAASSRPSSRLSSQHGHSEQVPSSKRGVQRSLDPEVAWLDKSYKTVSAWGPIGKASSAPQYDVFQLPSVDRIHLEEGLDDSIEKLDLGTRGQMDLYEASVLLTEVDLNTSMVADVVQRFQAAYFASESQEGKPIPEEESLPADTTVPVDFLSETSFMKSDWVESAVFAPSVEKHSQKHPVGFSKETLQAYSMFGAMEEHVHHMEKLCQTLQQDLDRGKVEDTMTDAERKLKEQQEKEERQNEVIYQGGAFMDGRSDFKNRAEKAKVKVMAEQIYALLEELEQESERVDFEAWLTSMEDCEIITQELLDEFNKSKIEVKKILQTAMLEADEHVQSRLLVTISSLTKMFGKLRKLADEYEVLVAEKKSREADPLQRAADAARAAIDAAERAEAAEVAAEAAKAEKASNTAGGIQEATVADDSENMELDLQLSAQEDRQAQEERSKLFSQLYELREKSRRRFSETQIQVTAAHKEVREARAAEMDAEAANNPGGKYVGAIIENDKNRLKKPGRRAKNKAGPKKNATVVVAEADEADETNQSKAVQRVKQKTTVAFATTNGYSALEKEEQDEAERKAAVKSPMEEQVIRSNAAGKVILEDFIAMRQDLRHRENRAKELVLKIILLEQKEIRRKARRASAPFHSASAAGEEGRPLPGRSATLYQQGRFVNMDTEDDANAKDLLDQQLYCCQKLNQLTVPVAIADIWTGAEAKYLTGKVSKKKEQVKEGKFQLKSLVNKTKGAMKLGLLGKQQDEAPEPDPDSGSDESAGEDIADFPPFFKLSDVQLVLGDTLISRKKKVAERQTAIEEAVEKTCKRYGKDAWVYNKDATTGRFLKNPWYCLIDAIDDMLKSLISRGRFMLVREDEVQLKDLRAELYTIRQTMDDELLERRMVDNQSEEALDFPSSVALQEVMVKAQTLYRSVETRSKRAAIPEVRARYEPDLAILHPELRKQFDQTTRPWEKDTRLPEPEGFDSRKSMKTAKSFEQKDAARRQSSKARKSTLKLKVRAVGAALKLTSWQGHEQDEEGKPKAGNAQEKMEAELDKLELELNSLAVELDDDVDLTQRLEKEKQTSEELLDTMKKHNAAMAAIQKAKEDLATVKFRAEAQRKNATATKEGKKQFDLNLLASYEIAGAEAEAEAPPFQVSRPASARKEATAANSELEATVQTNPSSILSKSPSQAPNAQNAEKTGEDDDADVAGFGEEAAEPAPKAEKPSALRRLSALFTPDFSRKLKMAEAKYNAESVNKPLKEAKEARELVTKIADSKRKDLNKMLDLILTRMGQAHSKMFETLPEKMERWDKEMNTARGSLASLAEVRNFWMVRYETWYGKMRKEFNDEVADLLQREENYETKEAWHEAVYNAMLDCLTERELAARAEKEAQEVAKKAIPDELKGLVGAKQAGEAAEQAQSSKTSPRFLQELLLRMDDPSSAWSPVRSPRQLMRAPSQSSAVESLGVASLSFDAQKAMPSPNASRDPNAAKMFFGRSAPSRNIRVPQGRAPEEASQFSDFIGGISAVKRMRELSEAAVGQEDKKERNEDNAHLPGSESPKRKRTESGDDDDLENDQDGGNRAMMQMLRQAMRRKNQEDVEAYGDLVTAGVSLGQLKRGRKRQANAQQKPKFKLLLIDDVMGAANSTKQKDENRQKKKKKYVAKEAGASRAEQDSSGDSPASGRRGRLLLCRRNSASQPPEEGISWLLTGGGVEDADVSPRRLQREPSFSSLSRVMKTQASDSDSEAEVRDRSLPEQELGIRLLRILRRRLLKRFAGPAEAFNFFVSRLPHQGMSRDDFYSMATQLSFNQEDARLLYRHGCTTIDADIEPGVLDCQQFVKIVNSALPIRGLHSLRRRLERRYGSLAAAYGQAAGAMDLLAFSRVLGRVGATSTEADSFMAKMIAHKDAPPEEEELENLLEASTPEVSLHTFQVVLRNAEGLAAARLLLRSLGFSSQLADTEKVEAYRHIVSLAPEEEHQSFLGSAHSNISHHPCNQKILFHAVQPHGLSKTHSAALFRLGSAIPASCRGKRREVRFEDIALAAVAGLGYDAERFAKYLGPSFPATSHEKSDDAEDDEWKYKKCHYVRLAIAYGYGSAGIAKRLKTELAEILKTSKRASRNLATSAQGAGQDLQQLTASFQKVKSPQKVKKLAAAAPNIRRGSNIYHLEDDSSSTLPSAVVENKEHVQAPEGMVVGDVKHVHLEVPNVAGTRRGSALAPKGPMSTFASESVKVATMLPPGSETAHSRPYDASRESRQASSDAVKEPKMSETHMDKKLPAYSGSQEGHQISKTGNDDAKSSRPADKIPHNEVTLQQLIELEAGRHMRREKLFDGNKEFLESSLLSTKAFAQAITSKLRTPTKAFEKLGSKKPSFPTHQLQEKAFKILSLRASDALGVVAVAETMDESNKMHLSKLVHTMRFVAPVHTLLEFQKRLVQRYTSVDAGLKILGLHNKQEVDVGMFIKLLPAAGILGDDAQKIFRAAERLQPAKQTSGVQEISTEDLRFALDHAHIIAWLELFAGRLQAKHPDPVRSVIDAGALHLPEDVIRDKSDLELLLGPLGFPAEFLTDTFQLLQTLRRDEVTITFLVEILSEVVSSAKHGNGHSLWHGHKPTSNEASSKHKLGTTMPADMTDQDLEVGLLAAQKLRQCVIENWKSYEEAFNQFSAVQNEQKEGKTAFAAQPGVSLEQWMEPKVLHAFGFESSAAWEVLFGHTIGWRHAHWDPQSKGRDLRVSFRQFSDMLDAAAPVSSLVALRLRLQEVFGSLQIAWTLIAGHEKIAEISASQWQSALLHISVPTDTSGQLFSWIRALPLLHGPGGHSHSHGTISKLAYLSAMKHAEASTRFIELLQRLCVQHNNDGSVAITPVSKAFENLCYDRDLLTITRFADELARFLQISSHDAKLIFHFLDQQQEGLLMVDDLVDALTNLQALYFPWKAVTAEAQQVAEGEKNKKGLTALKKLVTSISPAKGKADGTGQPGMGAVLGAFIRKGKEESNPSARSPTGATGLHAAITSHDLQGDRTPSSSTASRPSTVQASSSCGPSAGRSTAMTGSTALPADSDSDEEQKGADRPWSSMSGVAAPRKAEGGAVKAMRAHKKMQMAHAATRTKAAAGQAADELSPLPQLDLAVSTAMAKGTSSSGQVEEGSLRNRHGLTASTRASVGRGIVGRLPQLATVLPRAQDSGRKDT